MPTIIPSVANRKFIWDLDLISRGKVRDTYALPDEDKLLVVATDRISIFDRVLPAEIPQKGEVLTALNIFWAGLLAHCGSQDVVAFGRHIDDFLPRSLRGDTELQKRAMVVKKLDMVPVEAVVRGYLTGSGWSTYAKTAPDHTVCGHRLPPDLRDGDQLPSPIFTPTTKATEDHDEPMTVQEVTDRFGPRIETASLDLFEQASRIALERGIVIADTKFEFGVDPALANVDRAMWHLILGDERLTPDSSRFWLLDDWKRSRKTGTSPTSFDKQVVRDWGTSIGINGLTVDQIHALTVPREVLAKTAHIYRYIFYLLTGMRLETFQQSQMGIPAILPPIEIVIGSESDLPQIEQGLDVLRKKGVRFMVHVVSCHRNPEALRQYAETMVPENATVIAAAGKAAALPGVLQAWLRHYGKGYIPVLGVALNGNRDGDLAAARLSIERLPGTPVILRAEGEAYATSEGFAAACADASEKEFFVPESSPKEAKLNFVPA
jgi:phosphoribosylaminoimidazole-succinocarboxamide synthase